MRIEDGGDIAERMPGNTRDLRLGAIGSRMTIQAGYPGFRFAHPGYLLTSKFEKAACVGESRFPRQRCGDDLKNTERFSDLSREEGLPDCGDRVSDRL
jgi:hypothetical protein